MTGPECPDCAEMDSDADTSPPDFTATTLTGIIDDEEDPEGGLAHKSQDEGGGEDEDEDGEEAKHGNYKGDEEEEEGLQQHQGRVYCLNLKIPKITM